MRSKPFIYFFILIFGISLGNKGYSQLTDGPFFSVGEFSSTMSWSEYLQVLNQRNTDRFTGINESQNLNIVFGVLEGAISAVTLLASPEPFFSRLIAFAGLLDAAGRFVTFMQCGAFGIDDYLLFMAFNIERSASSIYGPAYNFLMEMKTLILKLKSQGASERKIARVAFNKLWREGGLVVDLLERQFYELKSRYHNTLEFVAP